MKKKLFLISAIVVALVCLFAISVSAAVTTYDDAPERTKYQCVDSEIVEFDDGFKCPVSYVFTDTSTIGTGDSNTRFEYFMDFTYINGKLGKTEEAGNLYTYANVVGFDIPTGITHVAKYAGISGTTLKWITFPDTITSLSNAIFQSATGLEECTFKFSENNTMRKFPSYMFFGCKNLKAFSMPDCFTSMYDVAHFSGCTKLGAVHLSNSLETWSSGGGGSRNATFDDCVNMYFVNEAFTYDNIPAKPEVYYFPANLSTASGNFYNTSTMRECKNLNDVLVFGTGVTKIPNEYLFQGGPANKIVFLGNMESISTKYWGSTTHVYFCNPLDKSTDDVTVAGGKTVVFCNAEDNTNHLYLIEKNTAPTCTENGYDGMVCYCGAYENPESAVPAQHDYGKTLVYNTWAWTNDNYFANANYKHICQVCEEEYIGEEIADSHLFVKEGYSSFANKNGEETTSHDVQFSIKVNQAAMDEYTNQTGKTVRYGTVAGVGNSLENPLSYAENELSVGASAVMSEMTGTDYVKLIIKIVKIPVTDEPVSVSCNAFAIVDSKLKYVSDGTVNETAEPKTV